MMKILFLCYIFFVICFFVPSVAYAYLDPGTGNALVYVVLSLVGAFFYFIKGFFYKIIKKQSEQNNKSFSEEQKSIVIFSEGKAYWNVFKPIVEKLIEKQQFFSYYTMGMDDPCLRIDSPYMDNCFIGDGHRAFVKIGNLNANIVLTTTPNIGTKGFPIPRSNGIIKLAYTGHSFDDAAYMHRGALNYYDAVMLTGEFVINSIRMLEKIRNLPAKELYPAGLPYMDELIKKASIFASKNPELQKITVLLAPSWGNKGFLNSYGSDFIEELAKQDFNLILRPHPQSLKVERKLIRDIEKKLRKYKNLKWDLNPDGTESFQIADIMISDTSAVRFDFALVYQKPFITIPIVFTPEMIQEYELADLGYSWTEEAIKIISYTLKDGEIKYIGDIIRRILREKSHEDILEFRNKNIYNLGHSGEVIAEYLINTNLKIQAAMKKDQ